MFNLINTNFERAQQKAQNALLVNWISFILNFPISKFQSKNVGLLISTNFQVVDFKCEGFKVTE